VLLLSSRVTNGSRQGWRILGKTPRSKWGPQEVWSVSVVERQRPERPPYVPTWVIPAVAGLVAVLVLAVGLTLWLGVRAQVTVPDVIGVDEAVAEVRLAQAGLTVEVVERPFDSTDAGTVLDQDPAPGQTLRDGDVVSLVVSAGTEEFSMPDVVGLAERIAKVQLEDRGLQVRVEQIESDAPAGTVVSTNPAPGAKVRSSDMVRLSVAKQGDAADALLPYKLEGIVIAIDPTNVAAGTQDATMEVSRRLRSLLEASGATVIVTRSATESATTTPQQRAAEVTGSVSAIVGLDVPSTGAAGLAVITLSDAAAAPPSAQASSALADAIIEQLKVAGKTAPHDTIATDPVLGAVPTAPGVRVRLGSSASKADTTLFTDPTWFDQIARAIYRGIGERLGAK